MSTRGHVAIKEDGKYRYIYNHHDSYIDGLGITLYKHYNNIKKIKNLLELGDTSSIGSTPENSANSYKEHLNRSVEERGTVAFFRESKRWKDYQDNEEIWEECQTKETEDINEVLRAEYAYIFDVDENKWYIAYWNDKGQLRDLEKVLHSKKVLEELFSNVYTEEYLPTFYSKCLSA